MRATLAILLVAACFSKPSTLGEPCGVAADCDDDQECADGTCQDPDADGDGDGDDGSDDGGSGDDGGASCIGCGDWLIGAGAVTELCQDSVPVLNALFECLCSEQCPDECAGTCDSSVPDQPCLNCAAVACLPEITACQNDTAEGGTSG